MQFQRVKHGGQGKASRKSCIACKGHRDIVGALSWAGLCEDCGTCHMVAWMLGLTHVYYEIDDVNWALKLSYTGPVIKVA